MSTASADKDTADTLAQLDLSSVDLSFSEQEAESAPPQAAAPAAPHVETPPPPPPRVDPFEPPPMEHLPDDPTAVLQLARRSEDFHSELAPPDVTPPESPEQPPSETPPPTLQPSTPVSPAPQQAHVDAPPSPRRTIRPKYPEGARRRREEGAVTLELSVDANGAVVGVEVVEPGLFAELRDAAVKAVRTARFKPATADGKPVPAKARLTLNFRLKDS